MASRIIRGSVLSESQARSPGVPEPISAALERTTNKLGKSKFKSWNPAAWEQGRNLGQIGPSSIGPDAGAARVPDT